MTLYTTVNDVPLKIEFFPNIRYLNSRHFNNLFKELAWL